MTTGSSSSDDPNNVSNLAKNPNITPSVPVRCNPPLERLDACSAQPLWSQHNHAGRMDIMLYTHINASVFDDSAVANLIH